MLSTPKQAREMRARPQLVWWLALVSGIAIIGAMSFLWGSRTAAPASSAQVAVNPASKVVYVTRETTRLVHAPEVLPVPAIVSDPPAIQLAQDPEPQVVFVDRPVPVIVEVRVEVEKTVLVEKEVLVPVALPQDPRLVLDSSAGSAPAPLPQWLKVGTLVYWYQPDGRHKSGKVTALNSDFVIVAWTSGKSQHTADFARQHFEPKARPRIQPVTVPAAVAEEELTRRGVSRRDSDQQEQLNASWGNRKR